FITDGALQAAADPFFTHQAGGRSISDLAERNIGGFLFDAVSKFYAEKLDKMTDPVANREYKEKVRSELSSEDSYRGLFKYDGKAVGEWLGLHAVAKPSSDRRKAHARGDRQPDRGAHGRLGRVRQDG